MTHKSQKIIYDKDVTYIYI